MVETVRWRIVRWSEWIPATNLESCDLAAIFLRERILRFAWVSIKVTSMSAVAPLVFEVYLLLGQWLWDHECSWEYSSNCVKGDDGTILEGVVTISSGLCCCWCWKSWSFWASRDCRRCSSSFTNSMAPPTIEAWSPCMQMQLHNQKQWEENKTYKNEEKKWG